MTLNLDDITGIILGHAAAQQIYSIDHWRRLISTCVDNPDRFVSFHALTVTNRRPANWPRVLGGAPSPTPDYVSLEDLVAAASMLTDRDLGRATNREIMFKHFIEFGVAQLGEHARHNAFWNDPEALTRHIGLLEQDPLIANEHRDEITNLRRRRDSLLVRPEAAPKDQRQDPIERRRPPVIEHKKRRVDLKYVPPQSPPKK